MALTIEQIQDNITNKSDVREIINQLADYIQANPGGTPGGASYFVSSVELTDTQIKALPTVSIELVPAPGLNKVILFMNSFWSYDITGAYTNRDSGGYLQITYGANDGKASSITLLPLSGSDRAVSVLPLAEMDAAFTNKVTLTPFVTGDAVNNSLKLYCDNGSSGDFTGGNAANTLKVTVYYVVVDV